MCARVVGGNVDDVLENESQASFTGCGTAPCFISGATAGIGNIISGTKYRDANNNGQLDAGEIGVPGVTISLSVDNGTTPSVLDAGDTFYVSTTTGPDGAYNFTAIPAGNYIVVETPRGLYQYGQHRSCRKSRRQLRGGRTYQPLQRHRPPGRDRRERVHRA